MRICVAGLGLIGGSMCMALKRADYTVYGYNRSEEALNYALENRIIDYMTDSFDDFDVVFIALPPRATLHFINSNTFKNGAIVCDICGVKKYIEDGVYARPRNFFYVGTHPMAGKEVSGIKNASADLFDKASMIITIGLRTRLDAVEVVEELVKDMGFARIVECSAETHDKKIGYTSQLAHVVSNAYVKGSDMEGCLSFTGGSFQDMTRIAGVDERVWSELYINNSRNLSADIDEIIKSLLEIKFAVQSGNKFDLERILKRGRELFESGKNSDPQSGVVIKNLK